MWQTAFSFVNLLAIAAWIVLIFLPRKPFLLSLVLYAGVGILCGIYAFSIVGVMSGLLDGGAGGGGSVDFTTMEGVQAIFASEGGTVIGWTHYLAFDLFVGIWIARDADAKGFNRFIQAPILLATFMAGPLGLFMWLIIRERKAREQGRWT